MTNEELKKKIVEIINDGIIHGEDSCGMPTSKTIENIADALIAAGIVDKSDYASMKETAVRYKAEVSKAEARAKEAELRAEVAESELERYTVLIKPLEAKNARLNHRAEVAERALDRACEKVFLLSDNCRYSNLKDDVRDSIKLRRSDVENFIAVVREKFLQQAEKELAEEGKND